MDSHSFMKRRNGGSKTVYEVANSSSRMSLGMNGPFRLLYKELKDRKHSLSTKLIKKDLYVQLFFSSKLNYIILFRLLRSLKASASS
jgi:hypothetical protein